MVEAAREQTAQRYAQECDCTTEADQHKLRSNTAVVQGKGLEKPKTWTEVASNPISTDVAAARITHLPEAVVSRVSEHHLQAIRRLTATTLPVRYSDAFFKTTVTDSTAQALSRVMLYESEPVGWIRCRLESCLSNDSLVTKSPDSRIYIQALALLSPYRNLGLATVLLDEVLTSARSLKEDPVCIYAHVWEKNEDALDWYAKRGFKRTTLVEHYYTKLRPSGAWIFSKELGDT